MVARRIRAIRATKPGIVNGNGKLFATPRLRHTSDVSPATAAATTTVAVCSLATIRGTQLFQLTCCLLLRLRRESHHETSDLYLVPASTDRERPDRCNRQSSCR